MWRNKVKWENGRKFEMTLWRVEEGDEEAATEGDEPPPQKRTQHDLFVFDPDPPEPEEGEEGEAAGQEKSKEEKEKGGKGKKGKEPEPEEEEEEAPPPPPIKPGASSSSAPHGRLALG